MFTPVSAFTTAEPPRSNIAVTMIFVIRQKARKTICAAFPHLRCQVCEIDIPPRQAFIEKK